MSTGWAQEDSNLWPLPCEGGRPSLHVERQQHTQPQRNSGPLLYSGRAPVVRRVSGVNAGSNHGKSFRDIERYNAVMERAALLAVAGVLLILGAVWWAIAWRLADVAASR